MDAPTSLPPGPKKLAFVAYGIILEKLLAHRGLATDHARLEFAAFFAALEQRGAVRIRATPAAGDSSAPAPAARPVDFVILSGDTAATSQKFREVLAQLYTAPGRGRARARAKKGKAAATPAAPGAIERDVLLIVPELPLKSHSRKQLAALRAARPTERYLTFRYQVFAVDAPRADSFDLHTVVAPADVGARLGPRHPNLLPKIRANDPALAWTGGDPGDIIEIHAISDSCGVAVNFREVIEA